MYQWVRAFHVVQAQKPQTNAGKVLAEPYLQLRTMTSATPKRLAYCMPGPERHEVSGTNFPSKILSIDFMSTSWCRLTFLPEWEG